MVFDSRACACALGRTRRS